MQSPSGQSISYVMLGNDHSDFEQQNSECEKIEIVG